MVERGHCPQHSSQRERWRGTKQSRGYDATWEALRPVILSRDPLCRIAVKCAALPIHKRISTQVDHIVPIRVAPERRLDPANLQGCCAACNSWKRSQDERKWPGSAVS